MLPKNWLVLAAMDEEEAAILEVLEEREPREWVLSEAAGIRGRSFDLGEGRGLKLLRTGIGPLNAALATAMACEREKPDAMLLLGVGGALVSSLAIGDLVLASRVIQHDSLCTLESGDHPIRSGDLVLTQKQLSETQPFIDAQGELVNWLRSEFPSAVPGTLVSGGEFAGRPERKRALARIAEDAILVDMEGASVAWVASRYGVPFAVAKTVADRLDPDGTIGSDFVRCLESSAAHAAQVVARIAGVC